MKQFTSVKDVSSPKEWIQLALELKKNPYSYETLGKHKTLGLLFLNPSLRTRLSTQKAARNLGMDVLIMNINQDGWTLETRDGVCMNGNAQEHIREAIQVICCYCDILGVRTFPSLTDKHSDYEEHILTQVLSLSNIPVVSLESAIRHPLQSFADFITIEEHKTIEKPKIVLSWAPHPRALPQAVPNSFLEWANGCGHEVIVTHPQGMELDPQFTQGHQIVYDQKEALTDADFIYVKNWSSVTNYGAILENHDNWIMDSSKMALTNEGKFMHCLPVRRNVVVSDDVIDGPNSLVIEQANNRTFATQVALIHMLSNEI